MTGRERREADGTVSNLEQMVAHKRVRLKISGQKGQENVMRRKEVKKSQPNFICHMHTCLSSFSHMACSSTLKKEVAGSSETLIPTY